MRTSEHAVVTANDGRTAVLLFQSGVKLTVNLTAIPTKVAERVTVGTMFDVNYVDGQMRLEFRDKEN